MPYESNADVPSYVPESKRERWRATWNSRFSAEIKAGETKEAAEQAAFRLANGVVLSDLANLAALSLPERLVVLRADLDKLNLSDLPEQLKAAGRKKIEKLARKNGVEPSQLLAPVTLDDDQNYATHSGEKVKREDHAYAPAGSKSSERKFPIHDAE